MNDLLTPLAIHPISAVAHQFAMAHRVLMSDRKNVCAKASHHAVKWVWRHVRSQYIGSSRATSANTDASLARQRFARGVLAKLLRDAHNRIV